MRITSEDIIGFVNVVDAFGGAVSHPSVSAAYPHFWIDVDDKPDPAWDPFSDQYFNYQISVYSRLSGRHLNQEEGEMHAVNKKELIEAPNPLGLDNPRHMSEYCRAILAMLSLADLDAESRVLDLGSGHGVSSELFAFTGCHVHSVDIDPILGEVARARAHVRNYPIVRDNRNFDDLLNLEKTGFDAAFFYQSLHHCLKPWKLIEDLRHKLQPSGVIAFAGEPIQTTWWSHWGIRLDPESVYVARKYGWFESGWSHSFISECFRRNGMKLLFFNGGLEGGEIGVASTDDAKLLSIRARAAKLGYRELVEPFGLSPVRYLSEVGLPDECCGQEGFRQVENRSGMLMYGPYAQFNTGIYEVIIHVEYGAGTPTGDTLTLDVVSNYGTVLLWEKKFEPSERSGSETVRFQLAVPAPMDQLEFRGRVEGGCRWKVSIPQVRKTMSEVD